MPRPKRLLAGTRDWRDGHAAHVAGCIPKRTNRLYWSPRHNYVLWLRTKLNIGPPDCRRGTRTAHHKSLQFPPVERQHPCLFQSDGSRIDGTNSHVDCEQRGLALHTFGHQEDFGLFIPCGRIDPFAVARESLSGERHVCPSRPRVVYWSSVPGRRLRIIAPHHQQ